MKTELNLESKPRLKYWRGRWWCKYKTVVGNGLTVQEAWEDAQSRYTVMVPLNNHAILKNVDVESMMT